jgi:BirA family biotin operon repressor/biotin-[acetyl-CoA-carboxylase] ligase
MTQTAPEIFRFDVLDSTNTKALDLGSRGASHGSCIVARNQTSGRGRLGKQWHSADDLGLYCSCIVRPPLATSDYPKITLLAGLAVAQVLDEILNLDVQLKWPNDIFINGCKCGGILTESSGLGLSVEKRFAVIGIGLNCNHTLADFPAELRDAVTSLYLATGRKIVPFSLLTDIRNRILLLLDQCCEFGFVPILAQWRKKDYLADKAMRCVTTSGVIVEGVAKGINEGGELLLLDGKGQIHAVLTSDISLAKR